MPGELKFELLPNGTKVYEDGTCVRDGIIIGDVCDQAKFEAMYLHCTGETKKFDPRVFSSSPCGSRMLLVREEAPKTIGEMNLIVPDSTVAKNPPGAGYVISVGDMVGAGTGPHPHGVRCQNPSDLLYKRLVFGMFSGAEYHTQPYKDGGFCTEYWVMTDRDVWFVDFTVEDRDAAKPSQNLLDSKGRNDEPKGILS